MSVSLILIKGVPKPESSIKLKKRKMKVRSTTFGHFTKNRMYVRTKNCHII